MDLELLKGASLIYVEDEADAREQTSLVLEDFFREVVTAHDTPSALTLLHKRPFDLLITDLVMPGQSGLELIHACRQELFGASLPVIVTTAHTETPFLLKAIDLGVEGYMLKPLDVQHLLKIAHKALLPISQGQELALYRDLINALGLIVGGRKIDILRHLVNNLDKSGCFYGSYTDIMRDVDVSKPTVVQIFRDLIDAGALERVKNGHYRFLGRALTQKD